MFFRARSVEPPSPPPKTSQQPPDSDDVLDALASVLRAFGENAFDTDERSGSEVKEQAEAWARRVLVGGSEEEREAQVGFSRDFRGARNSWWSNAATSASTSTAASATCAIRSARLLAR